MSNLNQCHIFLLDNFDSFTYNLVDQFRTMGAQVTIYRNDLPAQLIIDKMQASDKQPILVLSPGPGKPSDAGCLVPLIKLAKGHFPMLGICLGHQAMIEALDGRVGLAPQTVHGKSSSIKHQGTGPFANLINPMPVARYHSLMAHNVPDSLKVIATTDEIVMAVQSDELSMIGFQFHPESILTLEGEKLLQQSINHLTAKDV